MPLSINFPIGCHGRCVGSGRPVGRSAGAGSLFQCTQNETGMCCFADAPIAGLGYYDGLAHGFLLTPVTVDVPEPTTLSLLGMGLSGIFALRLRFRRKAIRAMMSGATTC